MEIRNLNTFLQVSAMKNFTKAADVLGYSQSNVSSQIKQLEDELGVPLFDRIGRSVTLTQYGEQLVPYAQQIVSTATHIENTMQMKDSVRGKLHLGIVESLYECIFQQAFSRYHEIYPFVDMEVTVGATAELLVMLNKNQIDVACLIDYPLQTSKWNTLYAKDCRIAVVANSAHPLLKLETIPIALLSNQEFIMMEESCSYVIEFRQIMDECKVNLSSFLSIQDPGTAIHLLEQGKYLSLLPSYSVAAGVRSGALKVLDIPELHLSQSVQIVAHKSRAVTSRADGFVKVAREVFEEVIAD